MRQLLGIRRASFYLAAGASLVTLPSGRLAGQATRTATAQAGTLPQRLSDADYWKLVSDISEPGGYFRLEDNFTSNEGEVGELGGLLQSNHITGGVYMGVGPEQNYSYIAAIRPVMAFIVDIRRQAVMQHLLFKAVFEMAKDRADFISLLFSKPRPAGLDSTTSIQDMWNAFWFVPTDTSLGPKNYARVLDRLTKVHGFTLTAEEIGQLKWVFDAFYNDGPIITTSGLPGQGGRGGGSSAWDFATLTGWSPDPQPRSFLSSEDNYRFVKSLHERNLVVPVSGDFGGPKAIRKVAEYLVAHDATVTAFYVSNVESYLFGDGKQFQFYANVATLPVTETSVFIRPYSMRRGGGGPTSSLCPIASFIRAVNAGRVYSNNDALACVRG
jgi:hypothetical protein